MFVDHFGRHLLGHSQEGWVFAFGRIAFPLFALVLGLNLARAGDRRARAERSTRRLSVWCAISVLPSVLARGEPALVNVLGTLALGAALCWVLESTASTAWRLVACLAIAAFSYPVEFGLAGVFLVPAAYLCATRRQPDAALLAAVLVLLVAWQNASFGGWPAWWGTLAGLAIAWGVRRLPLSLPRWQPLFYVTYPAHLLLIGLLKVT
ncbi:candidate membrane protein [Ramlibacter tataouinensis TTB310]|uniref:Candidate membrane protein n=2 Tax=Ramlibacter tataouinensis TaxID=94132 RepID=F5XWW9_RAMTT|nr:candidate membrane protein [Ramlibacter tataouinensis TTB310]